MSQHCVTIKQVNSLKLNQLAGFLCTLPVQVVYFNGTLGAGKTTTIQAWLKAMGYSGVVKSPTYTLVEPYTIRDRAVYHFDLYRLNDVYELELMGIRDYLTPSSLLLFEWPEKGGDLIPKADLTINIELVDEDTREWQVSTSSEVAYDQFLSWVEQHD